MACELDKRIVISQNVFNLKRFEKLYQELCDGIDLINTTFTFHLIPVMINSLLLQVFTAYGILWVFLSQSRMSWSIFLQNLAWLAAAYMMQNLIAYAGNSVTSNAKEVSLTITRILNNFELNSELEVALQKFVVRMNCRSLKVQNALFTVNWKLLARVSKIFNHFINRHIFWS